MEIVIITICSLVLCTLIYIAYGIANKNSIKITDKSLSIEDVIPIHSIEDDFIVNGSGDLTIGFKIFFPEVFALTDADAEAIHLGFENFLGSLPYGTVFHQQTFIYVDEYEVEEYSDNFLHQSNLKDLNKGIINGYSNIYITFTQKSKIRRDGQNTSLLRKAAIPFQPIEFDIEKRLKEINNTILNIESSFESILHITVIRMNSNELSSALLDYLNLSYDKPTSNASKEVVQPMCVTDESVFKIGDKLVSILSLVEEGGMLFDLAPAKGANTENISDLSFPTASEMKTGMMYPLTYGLPFNHMVNVIIEVTDPEDTINALNSERSSLNMMSNFYPPAKDKQAELSNFCDLISENSYQTSYTSVNIVIHDTNKDALAIKSAFAKQNFTNMNQSTAFVENAETANLFFTAIPGNARANYRGFCNITKQAVCYLNKEGFYLSPKQGFFFHDRFNRPIKIDLWDNVNIDNRNKIVIGPSGSGKSFWLNGYILQCLIDGRDTLIIDIGGSYKNLVRANEGRYFDSRDKREFQFNPFLCSRDKAGNYMYYDLSDEEGKDDTIQTIATLISVIWKQQEKVLPEEMMMLEKSVVGFYEYINHNKIFPDMTEYRKFLPKFHETLDTWHREILNINSICLMLEPYVEGGNLSYLLNAKEGINIMKDNFIAFDMENMKGKAHFPIVAMMVLSLIIDKIKRKIGKKTLLIDEALDFLIDEKFGNFIAYLYRTYRKKGGEVIIAAQNVQFIESAASIVKQSILANADTKIILQHGKKYLDQLRACSIIGISELEQESILRMRRTNTTREFAMKLGDEFHIFSNGVSNECAAAFDSRQEVVVEIERLFKKTRSIPLAIKEYLNKNKDYKFTTDEEEL